ncbi:hypothetical protein F2981_25940 (plasmid) [Sinorhizobium meliloti]|nr:hypothetical protein [Sinorhizobium meliloti]
MIVAPCSIKTLSEIATGITSGLLSRAADCNAEGTPAGWFSCCARRHCTSAIFVRWPRRTEAGAIICPRPGLLCRPQTLDEMVNHTVARVPLICSISIPGSHIAGAGGALPSLPAHVKISR